VEYPVIFFQNYPQSQNHRTVQTGRDLEKSSGPAFHGKGSLDEFIQHPVQSHLQNLQDWGLYHVSGRLFQWMTILTVKNFFLMLKWCSI